MSEKSLGRTKRLVVVLIAAVLAIVYLYGTRQQGGPEQGIAAPEFSGQLRGGGDFTLSEHRGNVVLLVFYATWCSKCNKEMRHIAQYDELYGGRGLDVAAVWIDPQNGDELDRQVLKNKARYWFIEDPEQAVAELYEVGVLPTMVLIDRMGTVRGTYLGGGSTQREALENELNLLLFSREQ
ncbi:MAG: TlpA disulfide reductase family protein [Candidatus Alcyoniella australis]|nr:TlpA disulfide reductase family protein [Candidatus Alcyoniella australis]